MTVLDKTNQFEAIWSKGYRRLCPIIPPGAPISERSNIKKRIAAGDDARGKIPGTKWPDGTWAGFDFVSYESTGQDVARWHAMDAGVGIKTGNGLVLIDADTKNPNWANTIKVAIEAILGELPVRIGNYPKAGYLCRTDAEFQYTRIEFGERNEKGLLQDRVEILSEGRQFVAHGIHPTTKQPYRWPAGVPDYDSLPFIPGARLVELLEALRPHLPAASEIVKEGAATDVDQNSLRLPIDTLRDLVRATRNTSAQFPTREAYRDYGYAIKAAAGPEHEADALEIYQDWAQRWEDGENDADVVEADFRRMKAPYRVGGSKLIEYAGEAGKVISAAQWAEPDWKPVERSESLFDISPPPSQNLSKSFFDILTLDQIANLPPPKFLIDRHVPERSVGFLYGDPGTGKSFIALDWALHIAYGAEKWHGDPITGTDDGMVVYLAGEGASGMRTRAAAWKQRHGYAHDSDKFGLLGGAVNFMSKDDGPKLVQSLQRHAERFGRPIRMIVVDTVSRAMPGADENSQKEMTLFVRACDLLRDEFGCAVVGVHHANKSGDMRGSTVLLGAGDFVLKLERKKGHAVGYLVCEKQKDAPDGWKDSYRFDVVTVSEKESSLVPMRLNSVDAETVPQGLEEAILSALQAAWDRGEPWAKSAQSKDRWAVKRMVNDFALDAHDAELKLSEWLEAGVLGEDLVTRKDKKKGLRRVENNGTAASEWTDVEAQQGAFE